MNNISSIYMTRKIIPTIDDFEYFFSKSENQIRIQCKLDFEGLYRDFLEEFYSGTGLTYYLNVSLHINPIEFLEIIPEAFIEDTAIENELIIDGTVKEVKSSAFYNSSFQAVKILSSETILNNGSFRNCKIDELIISNTFKNQINSIFRNCEIKKRIYTI